MGPEPRATRRRPSPAGTVPRTGGEPLGAHPAPVRCRRAAGAAPARVRSRRAAGAVPGPPGPAGACGRRAVAMALQTRRGQCPARHRAPSGKTVPKEIPEKQESEDACRQK